MQTPETDSQPMPERIRILMTPDEAAFFDTYRALPKDKRREISAAMVTLTEIQATIEAGGTVDLDAIRAKHHPIVAETIIKALTER